MCDLATLILTVLAGSWAGGLVALLLASRRDLRELQTYVRAIASPPTHERATTEEPFE